MLAVATAPLNGPIPVTATPNEACTPDPAQLYPFPIFQFNRIPSRMSPDALGDCDPGTDESTLKYRGTMECR